MRTPPSEPLSGPPTLLRIGATLSALLREQVDVTLRYIDPDQSVSESTELASVVDLTVALVERSAEWLELSELREVTRELRVALAQLDQLRPAQRLELVAHIRVLLDAEARMAEGLRTGGLESLVARGEQVSDAIDVIRSGTDRMKTAASIAPRGVIDEPAPDVGPQDNLLGLTFEIKSALAQQNERIGGMTAIVNGALRTLEAGFSTWERALRGGGRRKRGHAEPGGLELLEGPALALQQRIEEVTSNLRTLERELNQLLGIQYSLERRARDLDEHLLWEFLDPLERFVDEMVTAVSSHREESAIPILTVQTGGVGFEPEIGATLVPLLLAILETGEPTAREGPPEVHVRASREGLEARLSIEGFRALDPSAVARLETALEGLCGFVRIDGGGATPLSLQIQFPMARSLRNFLVVEAAGHRVALPWSAVERVHASSDDWDGAGGPPGPEFPLERLFAPEDSSSTPVPGTRGTAEHPRAADDRTRPLALLRCGGRAGAVGFDRIVWRESARLTPLPPRLYPTDEVLGGIVAPDSSVMLVLNPRAVTRPVAARGDLPEQVIP
jgi:hypothetical protein